MISRAFLSQLQEIEYEAVGSGDFTNFAINFLAGFCHLAQLYATRAPTQQLVAKSYLACTCDFWWENLCLQSRDYSTATLRMKERHWGLSLSRKQSKFVKNGLWQWMSKGQKTLKFQIMVETFLAFNNFQDLGIFKKFQQLHRLNVWFIKNLTVTIHSYVLRWSGFYESDVMLAGSEIKCTANVPKP